MFNLVSKFNPSNVGLEFVESTLKNEEGTVALKKH